MPDENEIDDIEEITRDETIEEDEHEPGDEAEDEALIENIEDEDPGHEESDLKTIEDEISRPIKEKHAAKKTKKAKSNSKPKAKVKLAPRKVIKKVTKKSVKKKLELKPYQKAVIKHVKKQIKKKIKAKAKHKNHKKRGPKGVQWTKWRIPYQENSTSGQLFSLASSKKGVSLKEFKKVCKSTGANPVVMLKALRSGKCRGWVWNVDDAHDRIRITNYHIVSKKGKSWWKGD